MNAHTIPIRAQSYEDLRDQRIEESRPPPFIGAARLAERRLKAACHRTGNRADLAGLYRKVRRVRRKNECAIVKGRYPQLASVRRFMTEYGAMIECFCRRAK